MNNMTLILCSEIAKRQNTDDNFGKTECVNPRDCRSFLLLSSAEKGQNFQNWGKNCTKNGSHRPTAL